MRPVTKYIKIVILVAVILVGGFSSYIYLRQPEPAKSPDLPILVEADKYAAQISKGQYAQAKKYSTPANNKLLDKTIKPQLAKIAKANGLPKIKFKSVDFEKSLLVNEDLDHQIVAEKMVFDTPKKKDKVIYLRFEIVKKSRSYEISNTALIDITT